MDVATSPAKGQDMSGFQPDFAAYKLVVLNYQGDDWPEATQKAFVDYVADGGGVVCYHFAAAAFPKWKEYNRIIAVGGWGERSEKDGPYLCWRDGKIVRATYPAGQGRLPRTAAAVPGSGPRVRPSDHQRIAQGVHARRRTSFIAGSAARPKT